MCSYNFKVLVNSIVYFFVSQYSIVCTCTVTSNSNCEFLPFLPYPIIPIAMETGESHNVKMTDPEAVVIS